MRSPKYMHGIDLTLYGEFTDVITKHIVPVVNANQCPPAFVLIYTIRSIIYPKLLIECIPDLLNLLGQLDHTRREAVRQARDALALHQELLKDIIAKKKEANVLNLAQIKALSFSKAVNEVEHQGLYRNITLSFAFYVCSAFRRGQKFYAHKRDSSIYIVSGHRSPPGKFHHSCGVTFTLILPHLPAPKRGFSCMMFRPTS